MGSACHVVIGAGPLGSEIAQRLTAAGAQVRIVTRSGSGADLPGTERAKGDVRVLDDARRTLTDAGVVYNCANPPYTEWAQTWPTLQGTPLRVAGEIGAVYVSAENLYMYGPSAAPIDESHPYDSPARKGQVRADMHRLLIAAHERGDVRAVAGRAADFIGPGVTDAMIGERVVPKILAGKKVQLLGDPEQPHTFTAIGDFADLLITLGRTESAWGRAWHAPSAPALPTRALVERLAALAGTTARITTVPAWALKALGRFVPMMRELVEMQYQWTGPYLIETGAATRTFGLHATDLDTTLRDTIEWYRRRGAASPAA